MIEQAVNAEFWKGKSGNDFGEFALAARKRIKIHVHRRLKGLKHKGQPNYMGYKLGSLQNKCFAPAVPPILLSVPLWSLQ